MKILITGGAGFIGSVLTRLLLKNDYKITVLDNFFFNQNSLNNIANDKNLKIIHGDVRDIKLIELIVSEYDIIIPLAALVGAPLCDLNKKEAEEINYKSINLLKQKISKNQRIILPVTNSGYGIGKDGEFCTEKSELKPISIYGKTKVAAEKIMMERENSISFRLATVFGVSERMRIDLLVNHFVYKALTDKKIEIFEGHFKRNYVHIQDVANVFLFAINNFEKMKSNVYNFGLENANLSKLELAEKIKSYLNDFQILSSKHGEDPDKRNYIVSNKKILSTGFNFSHDLDYGIKELINTLPKLSKNQKYSNV